MIFTARLLTLLAVILCLPGCIPFTPLPPATPPRRSPPPPPPAEVPLPADALQASPRQLVGRIVALDLVQGFAFVSLTASPPSAALAEGAELLSRTDDLRETARLRASRYARGRLLGCQVLSGRPSVGDEVVFQLP